MKQSNGEKPAPIVAMTGRQLVQTIIIGLIVGLSVWGLSLLLETYVFQQLLCQQGDSSQCGATLSYSSAVASVVGLGIGVSGLVYFRVFRPLLVGLAAMLTLWGLTSLTADWSWYMAGASVAALYAVAYALYAWVARLQSFVLALVATVLLVTITRLVLLG